MTIWLRSGVVLDVVVSGRTVDVVCWVVVEGALEAATSTDPLVVVALDSTWTDGAGGEPPAAHAVTNARDKAANALNTGETYRSRPIVRKIAVATATGSSRHHVG